MLFGLDEMTAFEDVRRRAHATSAVAALVTGTVRLGVGWWTRVHEVLNDGGWEPLDTPDTLLAAGHTVDGDRHVGSCLATLASWISDDAADADWGRPVDFVDVHRGFAPDRVVLPVGAQPGDRLVVAFDPGGRVWAEVVDWGTKPDEVAVRTGTRRGSLGTRLDEERGCRHCDSAHIDWAWAIATDTTQTRLPGERPGDQSDPFARRLGPAVAAALHSWAFDRAASPETLGRWSTVGDIIDAMYGLGWPYALDGHWFDWERAARVPGRPRTRVPNRQRRRSSVRRRSS